MSTLQGYYSLWQAQTSNHPIPMFTWDTRVSVLVADGICMPKGRHSAKATNSNVSSQGLEKIGVR